PHPTAPVTAIFDNTGTTMLYAGFFVMGLSQGLVEGDRKSTRLDSSHTEISPLPLHDALPISPHPTAPVTAIFDNTGTTMLYAGFFVMGLSQGLVEGVINPLVTTIYSDEKTKWLNRIRRASCR